MEKEFVNFECPSMKLINLGDVVCATRVCNPKGIPTTTYVGFTVIWMILVNFAN
jgi:hypothetical protein